MSKEVKTKAKEPKDGKKFEPIRAPLGETVKLTLVDDIEDPDGKTPVPAIPRPAMALDRLRASGALKLKKLRSMFAVAANNIVGAAATTITTVLSVSPGNVSEWSSLQALYDECKCLGGVLHFKIMRSAAATPSTLPVCAGVCYDPMNSSVLAQLEVVFTHSQHMSFGVPQSAAGSAAATPGEPSLPLPTAKSGFYSFRFKCPAGGAQRNVGSADVVTGQWTDTVASTADYGFLKFYVDAGPTGESYAIRYVLMLDIEFRSRS